MKMQRLHLVTLGIVVLLVVVVVIATTIPTSRASSSQLTLPDSLDPSLCPSEYGSQRPVILVSLDGFRPDYLNRHRTPTLLQLSQLGVHAPYLLPIYPTKTFTNHYTIVTGLYPESHGIVDNVFYDPIFRALFTIGSAAAYNGSWWGGEPIWNTLSRQGKRSATYFWPGSEADIGGRHPWEWFTYNSTISYRKRVNQVLMWVSLPPEERPAWVSLYLGEPDKQGHSTGPQSEEIDGKLDKVEKAIRELMRGLAEYELLNCVNVLFVSDHGMAQAKADVNIDLTTSVPNISHIADVIFGPSPQILLRNPSFDVAVDVVTRLSNDFTGKLRAFLKQDLPKRLHYVNNLRIAPIVLDVTPGYRVKDVRPGMKQKKPPSQGFHGYDYIHPDMAAFFVGYGPDLAQGKVVDPFQNIELYNLMCHLTGVTPAPNNGTWGALHHLLAELPPLPKLTQLEHPRPLENAVLAANSYQVAEGCEADSQDVIRKKSITRVSDANAMKNIPWGPPTTSGGVPAPVLLRHNTHVTGYSPDLKVPLWTSFTLHAENQTSSTAARLPWLADPRLDPTSVPTCQEYDAYTNTTMTPLFPPQYGSVDAPEEAYFITNAIGITNHGQGEGASQRWRLLTHHLLSGWLALHGPLNVVLGPVFDDDDNSRLDDLTPTGSVTVASDLFAVVTRCKDKVAALAECDAARLDSLAFIYPQTLHSWAAAIGNSTSFATHYTARVRDVELLTDLTFFPNLTSEVRLSHVVYTHRSLWSLP